MDTIAETITSCPPTLQATDGAVLHFCGGTLSPAEPERPRTVEPGALVVDFSSGGPRLDSAEPIEARALLAGVGCPARPALVPTWDSRGSVVFGGPRLGGAMSTSRSRGVWTFEALPSTPDAVTPPDRGRGTPGSPRLLRPPDWRTSDDRQRSAKTTFPFHSRFSHRKESAAPDFGSCELPAGHLSEVRVIEIPGMGPRYFWISRPELEVGSFGSNIDQMVMSFMISHELPQGSVAIMSGDGRLVYARGFSNYHFFDSNGRVDEFQCTVPHQAFRIASLSKPFTATAVFMLIEAGLINLSDPFMQHLDTVSGRPASGVRLKALPDTVWVPYDALDGMAYRHLSKVTIQDLLRHTGGWCEDHLDCSIPTNGTSWDGASDHTINKVFDYRYPLTKEQKIYASFQAEGYATHNRSLKWAPAESETGGSPNAYRYSSLGYAILGRVIEDVKGIPYSWWVHENIHRRLGMLSTYPGATREADVGMLEPRYYNQGDLSEVGASVLGNSGDNLPVAYGGVFNLSNRMASGGWVSTVTDYARFLRDLRWNATSILLSSSNVKLMQSGTSRSKSSYAHGWGFTGNYRSTGDSAVSWNGILNGTETEFVQFVNSGASASLSQNASVIAFFNRDLTKPAGGATTVRLTNFIGQMLKTIPDWGTFDLFGVVR